MDNYIVMDHYSQPNPNNNSKCDSYKKTYKKCIDLNNYILGKNHTFMGCKTIKKKMDIECNKKI